MSETSPGTGSEHVLTSVGGRRAAGDMMIQIVGRVFNLALGIAVTVLIVRLLGDEGFGQWSTAFAVIAIGGYFADFGFEQVALRRAAAEPEREREWLGALLTLRFALALPVALVCAGVVLAIADSDEMRNAGVLIALTPLLTSSNVMRVAFQLRVRNDISTAIMTINSLAWTAAVAIIYVTDAGMVTLAAGFVAIGAATAVLEALIAMRTVGITLRGSTKLWGELARIGISVGIGGLLTLAYGRIDQILVFQLAGDHAAGEYGAAYRILDSAQFLPIAAMTTLFPIISAAHPVNMDRVRRVVQVAAEYLAMASLPFLAFTLVASRPAAELLFGAEFSSAAPALTIFMGVFVLICFGYLSGNLVVVLGLQRRFIWYAAIALVFNVGVNLVVIPEYEFVGAAWVTLATEVLILLLTGRMVLRALELRPRLGVLARTLLAATLTTLALWGLRETDVPLGGLVAATAVLYPGLLVALGALVPRDLGRLLRREVS